MRTCQLGVSGCVLGGVTVHVLKEMINFIGKLGFVGATF